MIETPVQTEYCRNDDVRLLSSHGDLPSGARGRILGKFARPNDPTYLVTFEHEGICVDDVRSDEIMLARQRHHDPPR